MNHHICIQFGGVDISTSRNYFGRQKQSFEQSLLIQDPELQRSDKPFNGIFIRAPAITSASPDCRVLASLNHQGVMIPVAVKQKNIMVTSFHPELSKDDLRFHDYFLRWVARNKEQN